MVTWWCCKREMLYVFGSVLRGQGSTQSTETELLYDFLCHIILHIATKRPGADKAKPTYGDLGKKTGLRRLTWMCHKQTLQVARCSGF